MIAPTPYFSDRGCHVRIYEEAKALKARSHEVVIVTYHLGRDVGEGRFHPAQRRATVVQQPWPVLGLVSEARRSTHADE